MDEYEREFVQRRNADLVDLYNSLGGHSNESWVPMLSGEYTPGDASNLAVNYVGAKSADDIARACPKLPTVQAAVDQAVSELGGLRATMSPQQYGTAVHARVKSIIDGMNSKELRAEVSVIKSSTDQAAGSLGSIRIDTFEHVEASQTVCIGDLKTGLAQLTFARMTELAAHAQAIYPGTRRIMVFEIRPTQR